MTMMHIYNSNKHLSTICRISQKQGNDRKIKTVKFLFFVKYIKCFAVINGITDTQSLFQSLMGTRGSPDSSVA